MNVFVSATLMVHSFITRYNLQLQLSLRCRYVLAQ